MSRYFLELSYKGTNYFGWQIQPRHISVQEVLNEKMSILMQEKVMVLGSSRTDTGVHAKQTFAHFDTEKMLPPMFLRRLNFLLPDDIALHRIYKVDNDCHARFDAVSRSYEYIYSLKKNPFEREFTCYYPYNKPDINLMNEAAALILQHKEFVSFSKKRTQVKTTVCNISESLWTENTKEETFTFNITANRFLRGMVRGLVASQLRVGRNKMSLQKFEKLLHNLHAHETDFSAPANGLSLIAVRYPYPLTDEETI